MRRHLAVLATAVVLAAGDILALPAAAEMPMSPVYPTVSRPKRGLPAALPAVAAAPSPTEKPSTAAGPGNTKEAAAPPAKDASAGPVFEAAIPPPTTAEPDHQQPPAPAAEAAPPAARKKTAAKSRQRRPAQAPRYAYSPYPVYRIDPARTAGFADPQRGWGGGRFGPSPISDGQ